MNPGTYTLYGGISVPIQVTKGTFTSNSGTYLMTLTGATCVNMQLSASGACNTGGPTGSGGTLSFGSGTFTMSELAEANSAQVTLNGSGTYIFNSSSTTNPMLSLSGSTLTGNGVTLVFTSCTTFACTNAGTYDTTAMNVTSSTITLTAPTTGATAGIVMFGNNNTGKNAMPTGTAFTLDVDSTLKVTGAAYLPRGALQFAAFQFASENCTQIIADKIDVVGLAYFGDNCGSVGTSPIVAIRPTLVQ